MATIPAPTSFTTGERPTAAKMNANTKTALDFLLTPPSFHVQRNTAQSIPNGVVTAISFDAEVYDADAMWVSGSTVTVKTQGLWLLDAVGSFAANATGRRFVYLFINGVQTRTMAQPPVNTGSTSLGVTALVRLALNDTIELRVYQDSGAALNTETATNNVPLLSGVWQSK